MPDPSDESQVERLIDAAHLVVANYYMQHGGDGPVAPWIRDLDSAATTLEVILTEQRDVTTQSARPENPDGR